MLSHLTLKEAACTTILSHRWQDLWTRTNGSLDFFDGSEVLWTIKLLVKMKTTDPKRVPERPAFVEWVNRILELHKGATIDGFMVHFDLDSSYRSDIDSWINFAFQKSARRLELDLEQISGCSNHIYPFPARSVFPIQPMLYGLCVQVHLYFMCYFVLLLISPYSTETMCNL